MTVLVVRQYSRDYDKVAPLDLGEGYETRDVIGLYAAKTYLLDQGYDLRIDDPFMANRAVKFLPNPHYTMKVYLDASIRITNKDLFIRLIDSLVESKNDFIFCRHPFRKTVLEEVRACYRMSKIKEQQYQSLCVNPDILLNCKFLTQNGINFSRFTSSTRRWSENFLKFLDTWEVQRDQIALPIFLERNCLPNIELIHWPSFLVVQRHKMGLVKMLRKKFNYIVRK